MSRAGRDRAPAVLVDAVLAYVVPEEDLLDPATVEIVAIP